MLKHSLATHLVEGDVNAFKVQQVLGHASIKSTMAYVRVTDAQASSDRSQALMSLYR
jgi:site-specific recombinase XerD